MTVPQQQPSGQGAQPPETEVEIREVWAVRWPDGRVSGGTYSNDGSDYAEQMVRALAGDAEVVHRTVTLTTTPWVTSPPAQPDAR